MNRFEGTTLLTVALLAIAADVFSQTPPVGSAVVGASSSLSPALGYSQSGQPLPTATSRAAPPIPAAPGPSLKAALAAAQIAIQTCKGLEQNVGVTVLDSGGVPKVVLATDGTTPRGVQSSTNKALTALEFRAATSELGEKSKSDTALAGKLAANPIFNARAGGLVIAHGNDVIGAIGVGGAKGSEKDEACAKAALASLAANPN
jgi:uncharacterized protein GlcG (DUF336 family)